jgi:hypothetical protein
MMIKYNMRTYQAGGKYIVKRGGGSTGSTRYVLRALWKRGGKQVNK